MKRFPVLLTFVALLLVLVTNPMKTEAAKQIFKDVPTDHYASDAIKWAYEFDIISGYPDGTFRPNGHITEQQFAQIFAGYFDLEPVSDALQKYTPKPLPSDAFYNRLAAYRVPLNGYYQNNLREAAVKRGTVAQAIAYIADGQTTLNDAIRFMLNHDISSGQNPKYEQTNLQRFYGAANNLTRAQLVVFFYKLQSKSFFYRSEKAEYSYTNIDNLALYKRANSAQNLLDRSLRTGRNWTAATTEKPSKTWDGEYAYFQTYGTGDLDSRGRVLTISNSSKESFDVLYYTYDGWASGTVEGTAAFTTATKARMTKTAGGERCVIEFERRTNNTMKTTEIYCEAGRDRGTNYNGILTLE